MDNAELSSDLCYCRDGYNGEIACEFVPFNATLVVNSDNSLSLSFTDEITNVLNDDSILITIKSISGSTWKLEQVDATSYFISLEINEYIPGGTKIILQFLERIISVKNGVLSNDELYGYLNEYDPAPLGTTISAVTD